jgi:hypothetical protein
MHSKMRSSAPFICAGLLIIGPSHHIASASSLSSAVVPNTHSLEPMFLSTFTSATGFKPVSLKACENLRFENGALFATCASERAAVVLNRCMGNQDGFLVYRTE